MSEQQRADLLDRARAAFRDGAWGEARACFEAADRASPLDPEDVERLAASARLTGNDADAIELMGRAHQEHLARGAAEGAARAAFWVGFQLFWQGERAQAGGWLARAQRVLDDAALDCVVRGYLHLPAGVQSTSPARAEEALAEFAEAESIGARYGDVDLVTFARMGQGRALIKRGDTRGGVALLDEVMVAATAGEVSAALVGDIYCAVIDACQEIFDLRRAHEWTTALSRWCDSRPELVAHRGQCFVHRAEVLQIHGEWPDAMDEARRACERLATRPKQLGMGAARYRCAELHRLRGDLARAEEDYREASAHGRSPQPGLALLRLAQGQPEAAAAAIASAVEVARDRAPRARLLAAQVEILLAARDVAGARTAAEELSAIAAALDAPFLHAHAAQASGAVRLAEGDARGALGPLGQACAAWRELDAPYEGARASVLLAEAARALGDEDTAALELDAARRTFERLGAAPDLARLDTPAAAAGPLTARELEVLRLVATGATNRAIADALTISEKTVARHVANIFTKLSLSSRAAATAYAYRHGLL